MTDRLLKVGAVAEHYQVCEETVRRWIRAGKMAAFKRGRDYRIRESKLRNRDAALENV